MSHRPSDTDNDAPPQPPATGETHGGESYDHRIMAPPPRPPRPRDAPARNPAPPAELDEATRSLLADAIARAVSAELGRVRISSVPPEGEEEEVAPEPAPRSSIRVAAKVGGKVGFWGVFASGALSLAGSAIVWFMRPEYAAPLAQAAKLIAQVIVAAAGGGAPSGDGTP